jgi:hypothetical protein
MTSLVVVDLILESLTPSVNAPLCPKLMSKLVFEAAYVSSLTKDTTKNSTPSNHNFLIS